MKTHHFDGIYQEKSGFSMAMLVYRRVIYNEISAWEFEGVDTLAMPTHSREMSAFFRGY